MSIEINNKYGSIIMSQDVIAEVAGKAVSEVPGVVGLTNVNKGVTGLLKRDLTKGIQLTEDMDLVKITVHVAIKYGVKMAVVAQNIMENVTYQVQNQLGIRVGEVDVHIDDIKMEE